jgi:hypothetical protein
MDTGDFTDDRQWLLEVTIESLWDWKSSGDLNQTRGFTELFDHEQQPGSLGLLVMMSEC